MRKIIIGIVCMSMFFVLAGFSFANNSQNDFSSENSTVFYKIGSNDVVLQVEKSEIQGRYIKLGDDTYYDSYSSEENVYTDKPIKMYAVDGRTVTVALSQVDEWKTVDWYDYPVVKMYAPDGRIEIVNVSCINDWTSVGWYTQPVVVLYAISNNTLISEIFGEDIISAQLSVGWYRTKDEALNSIVNQNDLYLLARLIHAEAADTNYLDKCYVGAVVMNRVACGKWGNTIHSVITAKGQYSSYGNSKFNSTIPQDCLNIARALLTGERFGMPKNVIFQSSGKQGIGVWKRVDNGRNYCSHYYCYGNV